MQDGWGPIVTFISINAAYQVMSRTELPMTTESLTHPPSEILPSTVSFCVFYIIFLHIMLTITEKIYTYNSKNSKSFITNLLDLL